MINLIHSRLLACFLHVFDISVLAMDVLTLPLSPAPPLRQKLPLLKLLPMTKLPSPLPAVLCRIRPHSRVSQVSNIDFSQAYGIAIVTVAFIIITDFMICILGPMGEFPMASYESYAAFCQRDFWRIVNLKGRATLFIQITCHNCVM